MPVGDALSAAKKIIPGEALISENELVAFRLMPGSRRLAFQKQLLKLYEEDSYFKIRNLFKEKKIKTKALNYLWDMVDINGEIIESEFDEINRTLRSSGKIDSKASIIKKGAVAIIPGAVIGSQVTIDASEGPVIIDSGTIVDPLTFIKGPTYIGPNCRIVGGKIREGCSFGPTCRVGGEVEEAIMLGYCNKYHEGFLGHAYLGEWVNLGAMTTNSDLKNNYSAISVMVGDDTVDTGRIKVGCSIGDHTKTGIGTLLNTGISIGFSCNLYGGDLFIDKRIKSFSWGTPGNVVEYRPEKAIETAKNSMSRRKIEFSQLHGKLFADIYRLSGWTPVLENNKMQDYS
jgi:UDP-N-acetylglucosamine diphosphorylase/glucosamine-1-phosphate N-acetyltransferase